MKTIKTLFVIIFSSVLLFSCDIEEGKNLNGPIIDSVFEDLSREELEQTITGVLSDMRGQLNTQVDAQSVAGREYWRFQSSDPRWTADLMTGTLDNNTFYTTNPYAARYATIKNGNLLLQGLANTTANFSSQEVAAIKGFVNTIKAHELLMVLNQQYKNGIRTDVNDPEKLGPFESYDSVLTHLFELLTAASVDLSNGGDTFPFTIKEKSSGFAIANTPSKFLKFTNALLARIEAYRGNYNSVNTHLKNSFMDMNGKLSEGVYFTFSLTGADIANPLFFAKNLSGSNARIAHPSFIKDAEAGDKRLNKVALREAPLTQSELTGKYDVFIYENNVTPVSIIRNEELILLSAEANHISNPTAAIAAIDVVRKAAGLPAYSGGVTPPELINEILKQRRYSLYAEGGHRWIDLRRFNKLNTLPLDRSGDKTFSQFPIPANENQ